MKVLTILGSPKKHGNTSKVLDMLEEELILQGYNIERVHVIDYSINGCLGCNACIKEKDKPNCIQNDDAMQIFDRMMAADVCMYAFPLYAHSFPAQIKSFIDRHYCCVTNAGSSNQTSVLEGKRVAFLTTCCNSEETTDLLQETFDRIFSELKCSIVGEIVIASSAAPDFAKRAYEIIQKSAIEITSYKAGYSNLYDDI